MHFVSIFLCLGKTFGSHYLWPLLSNGAKPADHCTILAAPPSPENLQLDGGIFTLLKAVHGVLGLFIFLPLMFVIFLRKHVGSARGCGRST